MKLMLKMKLVDSALLKSLKTRKFLVLTTEAKFTSISTQSICLLVLSLKRLLIVPNPAPKSMIGLLEFLSSGRVTRDLLTNWHKCSVYAGSDTSIFSNSFVP